jgi:hypothetical protein
MKDPLVLRLYSDRRLTSDVARQQINALSEFENGALRPDKCDTHEPVRVPFNAADIDEPVRWLSQAGAAFMFRKGKPVRISGEISNESRRDLWTTDEAGNRVPWPVRTPEPLFTCRWKIYFDRSWSNKVGLATLKAFGIEMFQMSNSEYGFLTSDEDCLGKNYLVTREGLTVSREYVGLDPEIGVPGLYWLNMFGPRMAAWLGAGKLAVAEGTVERIAPDGVLLQFGESPDASRSPDVVARQQATIAILGEQKFFDINQPTRPLQSPFPRGN